MAVRATGGPAGWVQLPQTSALEGQVTGLVLGVDDLTAPAPSLEAVWLVVYHPPAPRAFVLGLSPETAVNLGGGETLRLREVFALAGGRPQAGDPFWLGLQTVAPVTPDVTVRLDREGLVRLLDFAGGAMVGHTRLSPDEALAWLEGRSRAGPQEALEAQAELLRGMHQAVVSQEQALNLAYFLNSAADHLQASLPAERLLQLAAMLLPLETAEVYVEAAGGTVTAEGAVVLGP